MGSLFTNLVQKVVISRKWTENGPMLDREWTDEVAEKSARMSTVWTMMWVNFVKLVNLVMQIFKWTKWTKWTEQIFAESAESAKSARSIFATFATFASANFVGKASCESTVRYREWSRIPSCCLRSAPVPPSFRLRLHPLRMVATLLLLLCIGVSDVWGDITWTWNASSGALGTATSYDASLTGTTSPSTSSENTKSWHVARSSVVYTGWSSSCIQMGSKSGAETVTLTSSAFSGTIKSVAVVCGSYNGAHKVAISVGGTSYLSATSTAEWTSTSSKSGSGTSKGEISIAFTNGSKALYIKSITVTYAPNTTGPFTVTYDGNGKTSGSVPVDAVEHIKNSSVTVLGNTGSLAKTGYTFNGWNTAADGSGTAYAAGSSIASITQDMTLYAQWKSNAADKVFYLVEDVSDLSVGQNIVIVSYYSSAYYAMSTEQRTSNRGQVAAGATEFTMSNSNKTLSTASTTHVEMLTLTSTDAGYFGFQTLEGKYLYASSSSANELKSQASVDNNAKWKVTLNTGVFSIQADKSTNRNHLRFNGGNSPKIFACYGSATQTAVLIYAAPTCAPLGSINGSINLIQRKQSEMDYHLVIISVFQRSHYLPFGHLPFGNYFLVLVVALFFV